jgi:hypothetical protein
VNHCRGPFNGMGAQSSLSFVFCSSSEHINVRASEIVVLLEGGVCTVLHSLENCRKWHPSSKTTPCFSSSRPIDAVRIPD